MNSVCFYVFLPRYTEPTFSFTNDRKSANWDCRGDVVDIIQIFEVKPDHEKQNVFWLHGDCIFENYSLPGEDWVDALSAWDLCEELVKSGAESNNFCHQFMCQNPESVPVGFAQQVARNKMKKSLNVAFPGVHFAGQNNNKKATKPASKKNNGSTSDSAETGTIRCETCGHDHDDPSNYKEVEDDFYFQEGERYDQMSCRECKKMFATERNKKSKKKPWRDEDAILLPKSCRGKSAFACLFFEAGKINCGNMLCHPCYLKKLNSSSRKRSRRGQSPQEQSSSKKMKRN